MKGGFLGVKIGIEQPAVRRISEDGQKTDGHRPSTHVLPGRSARPNDEIQVNRSTLEAFFTNHLEYCQRRCPYQLPGEIIKSRNR